jgi:hypothetical protein
MLLDFLCAGARAFASGVRQKGRSFIDSGAMGDGSGRFSEPRNDESAALKPIQLMRLTSDDELAAFPAMPEPWLAHATLNQRPLS